MWASDSTITLDTAIASNQNKLSHLVDAAGWTEQLANATVVGRATLLSEASLGGRAVLNALPSEFTRMEPAVFIAELRVRLQVPDTKADTWCPYTILVLDHYSFHAGIYVAGGNVS